MAKRNCVQLLAEKFSHFADKDLEPDYTHTHDQVLPMENPILVGQKPKAANLESG
jgi:hypothetical protein